MLRWIKDALASAQASVEAAEARKRTDRAAAVARQREQERLSREKAEGRRREQEHILAFVADGKLPAIDWHTQEGRLPFRFMKSEHLVYVFGLARYMEQRVRREVVGRSTGVSVRAMRDVYVRMGQSRGTPVESDQWVDRGTGLLAVTTKHLYFSGDRSFRIRLEKIVSFVGYDDGVIVTRDRAGGLPEAFLVVAQDEGYFRGLDPTFLDLLLQELAGIVRWTPKTGQVVKLQSGS